MKEFNSKLEQWQNPTPSKDAGINNIQVPGQVEHLIWQNRSCVPSQYELDFAEHLMQAFTNEATELNALTDALNQQGFRTIAGELWTTEQLITEMQRLGY